MNEILEFIKGFDLHTLISLGIFIWFGKTHFDKKFASVEIQISDTRKEMIDLRKEMIDLRKDMHSIDKRLISIETMLHIKDCCMLKDSRLQEKAD
jgi:hypothetical protein